MIRKNIERVRSTLSMRLSHCEELGTEDRGKENEGMFRMGEHDEEEGEVPAEEPARRVRQMVLNKRKQNLKNDNIRITMKHLQKKRSLDVSTF